jgi:DNA-binding response OmpR family regulator
MLARRHVEAMTFSDTESSHASRATGLQFDRYVLDATRGCLTLDGREIVLRPKTFAVLLHLVENPGRLIAKDELFAAVWPGVASGKTPIKTVDSYWPYATTLFDYIRRAMPFPESEIAHR